VNAKHDDGSSERLGRRGLVRRTAALAAAIVAVGSLVSGAGAAGSDPYTLQAQALLSAAGTDLTLRVDGPSPPIVLEKVQVKWRLGVEDAHTVNLFDVAAPGGIATVQLTGPARADRLEIRAHVKDGPQHNLEAQATVLRRPDLTVTEIDVPADIVRTRRFNAAVTVAEVGGDSAANARLMLFDGADAVGAATVTVGPGAASVVTLSLALARPGEHTLRAVLSGAAPSEWDVAANAKELPLYVHHYDANGVVATDHALATKVGVDVLRAGGNAFDAAVAVQFALNVTQPHLAGIGGGSNVLVRLGDTGEVRAIDARETASAATSPTTFAGLSVGAVRPHGFAVGVPGTLRALEHILDEWGTTTLAEAVEPAIALAEGGFPIGFSLARNIVGHRNVFQPETAQIFLTPAGDPRPEGSTLFQPDLAKTFRLIARDGADVFYRGEIAEAIVAAQRRGSPAARQGKMTMDDLASYTIDVESPLSLEFRGYDVVGAPPSTNGGLVLLESLGLIREFLADPRNAGYEWGFGTRNSLHVFIEAMRLAFADRDWWIGDDRFTNVPVEGLLDRAYLRDRSALIGRETTMCNPVPVGNATAYAPADVDDAGEVGHTTHASIIDRWGNAVVITSTIADSFGTGISVPGYGFLLNDSATLFNFPSRANAATGNPGANDAGGGKRPAGSMAPTLILKDGEPYAATGTYSGGFIPSVVLNVVLNLLEFDMPLQEAIDAPRIWTTTAAGAAQLNFGLDHLITPLREMGHIHPNFGGCADNLNRTPLPPLLNLGSTGSFGVDLGDFSLLAGEDGTRWPDASTVVVGRN
jgi:gamma-glutamyltranspeptidase/glutathione hydrolase